MHKLLFLILFLITTTQLFSEDIKNEVTKAATSLALSNPTLSLILIAVVGAIAIVCYIYIKNKKKSGDKSEQPTTVINNTISSENPIKAVVKRMNFVTPEGQSNVNPVLVKADIHEAARLGETYEHDVNDIRVEAVETRTKKVASYLKEIIADISTSYTQKLPSKVNIKDINDIVKILIKQDFNEVILSKIKDLKLDKNNDTSIEAEKISKSSIKILKDKFLNYPIDLEPKILNNVWESYSSQLLTSLNACIAECKTLSVEALNKEEQKRKEYTNQVKNLINNIFQFDKSLCEDSSDGDKVK